MATLGIKINAIDFAGTLNYNESYIHGYSGATAADVNGSVLLNGVATTVPKGILFSNRVAVRSYIVFDSSGANFALNGQPNSTYVVARLGAGGWEYDNNGTGWIGFSAGSQHWIIGKIDITVRDTNTAPGVSSAAMFDVGIPIISDAQYVSWLKSPTSIRCVLVEADVKTSGGTTTTRYLSSRGYITNDNDWPATINYSARVTGGIKFSRSLSLEGQVSLSFGDIELINTDGALDSWLDDFWVNRDISVLVGDPSWARANFRPLYKGSLTGVDSRKRDRINLKLGDLSQRLNTVISEAKLGGSSTRADELLPLCFGECHNITPVLIDSTVNEYMVHNGPIESIIEVRDNGVPVAYTATLSTGKFRLTTQPAGTVTVSVQGAQFITLAGGGATYSDNLADIVYTLMTTYGTPATRLTDTEVEMTAFSDFKTANTQHVGIYIQDRQNVLDVCNTLASSIGARLFVNRNGRMSLVQLSLPWGGATVASIGAADIVDRSLEPKQLVDVVASVKVGYCKNWTVQEGLTTGLIQEHIALFAEEWLSQTATDSTAAANYNLYTDPTLIETNLLTASEALAEANRRLAIFSTQRKVFKFTGMPHLWNVGLGNYVNVTNSRFGLSGGMVGQILSVAIDPMSPQIEFEVLV